MPFVHATDESILIGPPQPMESYLRAEKIIAAAHKSGAQAIHPGYGFLSENADFVRACEKAGLVFIGPTAASMDALSNKQVAREVMEKAGMPVIPGSRGHVKDESEALAVARSVGYPVIVKASFGGGGIGMTIVEDEAKLAKALQTASSRAERAFSRGEIYIEKLIRDTHHIEFQVLADLHGNVATLGERECSVQRRQQKVIEETPSTFVTEELRRDMSERIVAAAKAIGYRNAGTFECLVDGDRNWYFLEVNKRLQVEHPITEMVTGLDLVKEQIRIAAGEPLSEEVRNAKNAGHSIEARLYAEDPNRKFLPQPGELKILEFPIHTGIRVDNGVESGSTITPFYDPLIAKVISFGKDRDEAIIHLTRALATAVIDGIATNRDFLVKILGHHAFVHGGYTTAIIDKNLEELLQR
jgi:acetyl-CoA carboxylase, biotin carboxylase subunit